MKLLLTYGSYPRQRYGWSWGRARLCAIGGLLRPVNRREQKQRAMPGQQAHTHTAAQTHIRGTVSRLLAGCYTIESRDASVVSSDAVQIVGRGQQNSGAVSGQGQAPQPVMGPPRPARQVIAGSREGSHGNAKPGRVGPLTAAQAKKKESLSRRSQTRQSHYHRFTGVWALH